MRFIYNLELFYNHHLVITLREAMNKLIEVVVTRTLHNRLEVGIGAYIAIPRVCLQLLILLISNSQRS